MDTFLEQSRTFMRAITESFHLINITRAGSELLTEGVSRIVNAGLNDQVITALYPMPAGTTGQNLRAHVLRPPGERDQDVAEMWLLATFARYESWAESLEADLGIAGAKRGTQFPVQTGAGPGYAQVFSTLTANAAMMATFEASVLADKLWLTSDADVEHALVVYRYFKEVRNSLAHSSGQANPQLAASSSTAQSSLVALLSSSTIRAFSIPPLSVGDPISVTYQTVRDLVTLLRLLVFTIDARIFLSSLGAAEVLARWRRVHGTEPVSVEARKLNGSGWFRATVSNALSIPEPSVLTSRTGATWPNSSRTAFTQFASENNLIHVRRW